MNLGEFRVSETSCEMRKIERSLKAHFLLTVPTHADHFQGLELKGTQWKCGWPSRLPCLALLPQKRH